MQEVVSFYDYCKRNWGKSLSLWILYQTVVISIGSVNYYFIDDVSRRVTGVTDFVGSYARYFSEFMAYLVQGSGHLTDLGITTFILSGTLLTLTSLLAIYLLVPAKKMSVFSILASLFIGLNPWSLELVSFKFDTPYMTASVFLSFLPFLWFKSRPKWFVGLSVISIFLMYNAYQASSGIYIVLTLLMTMLAYFQGQSVAEVLQKLLGGVVSYLTASVLYLGEMRLNPQLLQRGGNASMAKFANMPVAILRNLWTYLLEYQENLPTLWKVIICLALVTLLVKLVQLSQLSKGKTMVVAILVIGLSILLSLGVYIVSELPMATQRPRYIYGLAVFIALIFVLLSQQTSKWTNGLSAVLIVGLTYYSYSFSLSYAATLDNQKIDFEAQSIALSTDLNHYVTDQHNTVYINRLFEDSPAYSNSLKNFSILDDLVPSNSTIYWPNVLWYNEVTHSKVNFVAYDFSQTDLSTFTLLDASYHYDIYTHDDQLYVIMK